MKDLVDTTEMYLRTIYELIEEGITPLRARIVERLEQSGPTVSQTVARMERDGLLHVKPDRSLELTAHGEERAVAVMRKHRLAERLLTDVLKLDIALVHQEACRWEHVMSDEVERRLVDLLPDVQTSPFGNPIPGLDKLGVGKEPGEHQGERLNTLPTHRDFRVTILELNEILQNDSTIFSALQEAGVYPGAKVTVHNERGVISIHGVNNKTVELAEEYGHAIRVAQD